MSKIDPIVSKQIEELQAAATQNAESICVLAEKLQQTIQGIDIAADNLQKQAAMFTALLLASSAIAIAALAVASWAIIH